MNPLQVLWLRAVIALLVLPFLVRRAPHVLVRTRHLKVQLARSLLLACAGLCFFFSLQKVPLADAVAIVFVSPLFTTAIAFAFLGEAVGWRRWSACMAGFAGALLIIRPGMGVHGWMYLLPAADALFSAIYVIATRRIGIADSTATSLLYSLGGMAVLFALPMIWLWQAPSPRQWLLVVGLSLFALTAHFCNIRAYATGEASLMAPLSYIHVVFTTAMAFAVFGTLPDAVAAAGIVLIVGAGLYILHRETIRRGRPRPAPAREQGTFPT
jgi:drug/metabolite transporter (DMT)-like permease